MTICFSVLGWSLVTGPTVYLYIFFNHSRLVNNLKIFHKDISLFHLVSVAFCFSFGELVPTSQIVLAALFLHIAISGDIYCRT